MVWRGSGGMLLCAALCVAALAGCGGSTDSTEPTGVPGSAPESTGDGAVAAEPEGPPTRAEFIAAADEICAQANEAGQPLEDRLEAIGEQETSAATLREGAGVVEEMLPLAERQLAALRALEPPPADAGALEENWDRNEAGFDLLRELVAALEDLDTSAIAEISSELNEIDGEIEGFERGYGMKACASED
jgi:hypothetical protein